MPSEQIIAAQQAQSLEQPSQQTKHCTVCRSTVTDHTGSIFIAEYDFLVCPTCRDNATREVPLQLSDAFRRASLPPSPPVATQGQRVSPLEPFDTNRTPPSHEATSRRPSEIPDSVFIPTAEEACANGNSVQGVVPTSGGQQDTLSYHGSHSGAEAQAPLAQQSHAVQQSPKASSSRANGSSTTSSIDGSQPYHLSTTRSSFGAYKTPPSTSSLSTSLARRPQLHQYRPQPHLDPLVDITRLRVRSQGHRCLYPGATFDGTQKSGRNSYEVNVTIVDVDFASSFLCGYLRIRGLTDDWPELTTYFDAEIIGSRYGFLTQNWGATEHEDMVHWARFPAFKHVKNEAKKPHMTIDDRDRGAVFMRWKEKFLVPDHRVQDISGASFAGFYYVCVDFNSQSGTASTDGDELDETMEPGSSASSKSDSVLQARRRRASSSRRRSSPSSAPRPAPVATMNGFYYHQNSEPYQQLSLTHVVDRTTSSFEFR